MANAEHLRLLRQGVDVWNEWRETTSAAPDLKQAVLVTVDLAGANLVGAYLDQAHLTLANLNRADLSGAILAEAVLVRANLSEANLSEANLTEANLVRANLSGANLSEANLSGAKLAEADLRRANLVRANLSGANLSEANLSRANLSGANLINADLSQAVLVETGLVGALLTGCNIYGISAWNVKLSEGTKQLGLIITPEGESEVTVDDLEVAQFVYLLLHNDKIRRVIDTVGKKGVLLLGRFTEGRIVVLERLQEALRDRGYLPIVFNFDKPETKDFTETVRLLAGLSKFVIADLTSPKSAPYELGAIVSQTMIPFQPIIAAGETPFAMLQDLWINYPDRVFKTIHYSSGDALIASLDAKIIRPAEARFAKLVRRKSQKSGRRAGVAADGARRSNENACRHHAPRGKVLLRPEFNRLGPRWPVIACRTLAILTSIHDLYDRGRDIIISTGIIDDHTPPEYVSMLLAAVTIELKQVGETRKYIHPDNYQKHIEHWGREQWPHCSPILCAYHLPLIDAHAIIPGAYRQLGVLGEGRLRGGALLVEGVERERVMTLPVKPVALKLSPDVVAFQAELKRRGVATFPCA